MKPSLRALPLALLLGACASTAQDGGAGALDPAALTSALDAELLDGAPLDLSAAQREGRALALVFWQAW